MPCAIYFPNAVRCFRVEHDGRHHVNMEAADPGKWSVGDIAVIGGLLASTYLWWKNNPWKKIRNMWSAPDKVDAINEKLDTIINALNLVISMTQNTWKVMDTPLWQADAQGKTIHVNKYFLKILYRQESEMLGNGWINSVHEDDRERVSNEWENAIEGQTNFYLHYRLKNASGEDISVIGEAFKLTNPNGEVLGYMGCITILDK